MKKISRRSFLQVCGITAATAALTACGGGKAESGKGSQNGRIQITFYLWDRSMMKELTPWLEQKFPEYEFNFIQGFNTMDYYRDLLNRAEQLPDIITCRRFSLNDAAPLAEHLMDLSTTEVAGTFYSSYLNNNQEPDGAIRWLPMCAEVDGTAANVDLFAQYNIPLPTNYAEFVAAINAFEAVGIKGYQADWRYDYTCLETMQGSAIPELMSLEGTTWRMNYESETEDGSTGLDDVVWPKVFEKYEQFLRDVRVQPGDDRLELNPIVLLSKTQWTLRYHLYAVSSNFKIILSFCFVRCQDVSFLLWSNCGQPTLTNDHSPLLSYMAQFRFSKIEIALFCLHELFIRRICQPCQ